MVSQTALLASEVSLFDPFSWFFAINKGVYWIINAMESAYGYLAGIKPISNSADMDTGGAEEVGDILLGNFRDSRIQQVYFWFLIFATIILALALAIGMIKACFVQDDQLGARRKMIEKSIGAFLLMILLPIIIYIGVVATGALFRFVQGVMLKAIGNDSGGIAQSLHEACLPQGYDANCKYLIDPDTGEWLSYNTLSSTGDNGDYQYFLGMIAGGILVYVLLAICTSLVERLIEVVFFYLIGPFVLARTPLDDGGSFKLWKDIIIAKLLSAGGVILCMYLYLLLLGNINAWFTPQWSEPAIEYVSKTMVRVFFVIGGAFAVKKGALSIAQVISSNTGISEGMSQGQSLHMLSSGLRLGMGIAKGALGGAMMGMRTSMANAGGGAKNFLANRTGGSGGAGMLPTAGNDAIGKAARSSGGASPMSAVAGGKSGGGAMPSAMPGADAISSASGGGGNAFLNPFAGGAEGQLARVAGGGGGGSMRQAFMYGGVSGAAGAGLAKLAALPFKGIKAGVSKLWNMPKAKAARSEHATQRTKSTSEALNTKLGGLLDKNDATAQKISNKYGDGGLGYSKSNIESLTNGANAKRMQKIEKLYSRLNNAGALNKNIQDRLFPGSNSSSEPQSSEKKD